MKEETLRIGLGVRERTKQGSEEELESCEQTVQWRIEEKEEFFIFFVTHNIKLFVIFFIYR